MAMDPVFAPGVPVAVRRLYADRPELFVPADAARPKRQTSWSGTPANTLGQLLVWVTVCVGGWILATIVMGAVLPTTVTIWVATALAALAVLSTAGILVKSVVEDRGHKSVRLQHGQYLLPADFDEPAARLLTRAQRAVKSVLEATVTRRGLLDDMQNELVLPEQLWDVAQVLREQTVLRARQRDIARGMATAELDTVLGPQRRALALSVAAIDRKVALLEQYATRVQAADAALRAEAALADSDRYLDLLARTEPLHNNTLLENFTDEATALRETFTRSITAARSAGKTLTLPE
ncbi:hypothetical protein HPO96_29680 [Kribbella sandramycini]|uniref:Uncharacterized protein n=1 Tax=Kribbella sandramycini TaxID=60450 RepID=A0A7Y4L4X9_9ACTN|nr:hypothetical protein [Kribbella sandramycini]